MNRVRLSSLLGLGLGLVVASWSGLAAAAFGAPARSSCSARPIGRGCAGSARGTTVAYTPSPAAGRLRPSASSRRAAEAPTITSGVVRATAPAGGDSLSEGEGGGEKSQLVFPGGGIFFYWQAGAVTYLRESYDLSSVSMSGASAGALTATLASTGVDFHDATDLALRLADEAGVWDRPLGLQGVWGPIIERWLDELLPEDAHARANEADLQLLITPVPSFGKTRATDFANRSDLIRANMASVHIPWFLDGKLTTTFRDEEHIDGSFLSKATDYASGVQPRDVVTLDWTSDPAMSEKKLGDFVEALSKDGIWDLVERGKSYAALMEKRGDFELLPRL